MFQDPEIFKAALDNLPVGVYMVDTNRRIVFWSHGAELISGYLAQEVLGRECREKFLIDLDESNPIACGQACQLTDSMCDGKTREADVLLRHRAGHRIPVHVRAIPLRNNQNKIVGATECFEESRYPANDERRGRPESPGCTDKATGLPDTSTMTLRLQECFAEFENHRLPFCVLMAEVDQLPKFHKHGKDAVDAARAVVAQTLSNALRPGDIVGCWHEDRFLAIIKNCDRSVLKKVGERVRKMESYSEVEWWGDELPVSVSIGGTVVAEGDQVKLLLERAQAALNCSSKEGGNRVMIFPEDALGRSES
ncbi:MAG TPA: PAS domain-containing protein [Candidatus Angelobacter sp.]|jgi:diguanylate cyclase (GGDEF)-like protein/PAS domain S-box-containing protein